ncbi:MAG: hypothetical protein ABI234_19020 [Ktedonobacteraceae bacterium]
MRLIRADGHQQQQWALVHVHTQTIARIFSEHISDFVLIIAIAQVLQKCTGEMHDDLDQKLTNIRNLYQQNSSKVHIPVPDYIIELLQALHELYYQPRNRLYKQVGEQINSLRGAVVELIGLKLIKPRYNQEDECANSRRFVDRHNTKITLQEVDIAALSHTRHQLEGYECKTKAVALMNDDRIDLEYLYKAALEENYQAHVGVISLDPTKMVLKRLRHLGADDCVQAYGVDMLRDLHYSPFDGTTIS